LPVKNPESYQLERLPWQLFGTLTFTSERLPEAARIKMWFALARQSSSAFRVYFPSAIWCLRQELGEATGRKHFHYLFGGLPQSAITQSTCFAQMAMWERLGGGMARVRVYDGAQNGVSYIAKCLGSEAKDSYEFSKFASSSDLMLSKAGWARLGRVIREDRRGILRTDKTLQSTTGAVPASPSCARLNHQLGLSGNTQATYVLRHLKHDGVGINSASGRCIQP